MGSGGSDQALLNKASRPHARCHRGRQRGGSDHDRALLTKPSRPHTRCHRGAACLTHTNILELPGHQLRVLQACLCVDRRCHLSYRAPETRDSSRLCTSSETTTTGTCLSAYALQTPLLRIPVCEQAASVSLLVRGIPVHAAIAGDPWTSEVTGSSVTLSHRTHAWSTAFSNEPA